MQDRLAQQQKTMAEERTYLKEIISRMDTQLNEQQRQLEKSALLEEQKSVMQHCAEERRKLAAEWAHFHALEKQRHERAEREVGSLLEKREGSIIGLAQVSLTVKRVTCYLCLYYLKRLII
ncbi:hypothetical protein F2P81_026138 [Scophthalmus maximus]|uniref:Uncharacterized protein n=1 Tax=Scophthalmus maximus TaxID=52904 RepID=A0A6A4RMT7_SCOMX|nr:hypothetical protein F2P81_026138 [Scophthalmus maximus]